MYRVLGRDPVRQPLTELEMALFERAILMHWEAEVKPRAELGIPPSG